MNFDREYFELCSEKTLQVDKEGFFLQFANSVAENVGETWIQNEFGSLKTDKERIRKIYEDHQIKPGVINFLTNVQEIYRKKCPQTAKKRLLEAESALKSGDKKKALILYSQSILKAPKSDPTLSTAFLSRAKILISLNEYSNALTDLQMSLQEKIPTNSKFEVFWMMAICYKALNDENKSKVSLNLAEKLADDKLRPALRHSMTITYQPIKKSEKELPPINERHVQFKHASKKISVAQSEHMGRHIIANQSIKTGEILVVEDAAVACLLPEKFGTHCHHCFARFLAPVGCPDCASVAFCCPKCRDDAILTYHKYECKFLDLLIGSGMSVLSLAALRIITQKNLPKCLEGDNNVYQLCTNSTKRPSGDFLQRTLMAAFLLRCLQKSHYFTESGDTVVPTEQEYQVGEKLLHYLQVLQFNAHEICETLYTAEHRIKSGRQSYIGVAVYPTVSLFNHECHPCVTRYFVGKHIVITSIRPVNTGDLIAENYGPIFTHRSLTERQRLLSARYWFNCKCQACVEDWSLLKSGYIRRVRCQTQGCPQLFPVPSTEDVQCPHCHKNVNLEENAKTLEWCEEQYVTGSKLVENREKTKAIKVLSDALDQFYRVSAPPHKETHLAEATLRLCFADFGNTCDCLIKLGTH